jgi:hypothetical protein
VHGDSEYDTFAPWESHGIPTREAFVRGQSVSASVPPPTAATLQFRSHAVNRQPSGSTDIHADEGASEVADAGARVVGTAVGVAVCGVGTPVGDR